jgi:hypothetical protein
MDVTLMAHVHDKSITGGVEDAMQGNRQFYYAKIWPQMTSGLRQDFDKLITHFVCELREILFAERFDIGGRTDPVEQARRRGRFRRV